MPVAPETGGFAYANSAPDWVSDPVPMWMVGFGDWNWSGDTVTDEGVVNTIFPRWQLRLRFQKRPLGRLEADYTGFPLLLLEARSLRQLRLAVAGWQQRRQAALHAPPQLLQALVHVRHVRHKRGDGLVPGYQLPAFVRFLKLQSIEQPPAGCTSATLANMPADCSLLLTGVAPETSLNP